MQVDFSTPKNIVTVPQQSVTTAIINVNLRVDYPEAKRVQAQTKEIGVITLWSGSAYDAIGQWTDTDVINRIYEMYN